MMLTSIIHVSQVEYDYLSRYKSIIGGLNAFNSNLIAFIKIQFTIFNLKKVL